MVSPILPKNELENSNFCPSLLGQKFVVHFLGEFKKSKCHFKINWPLACTWKGVWKKQMQSYQFMKTDKYIIENSEQKSVKGALITNHFVIFSFNKRGCHSFFLWWIRFWNNADFCSQTHIVKKKSIMFCPFNFRLGILLN